MAIATRRDDSVVSALGELRGLEDARRRADLERTQREIEARLAAQRAAAETLAREAAAAERARAAEAHDAAIRAEAIARAERLVAIEAAARAKATAELALAAERQTQELAIKREVAARTRPRGLVAAVILLGVTTAGVGALALSNGRDRDAALAEARYAAGDAERLRADLHRLERRVADLQGELAAARRAPPAATIATPPPSSPPPAKPHPGGKGGRPRPPAGTGAATSNQVDLSSGCIDDPLGRDCPTR